MKAWLVAWPGMAAMLVPAAAWACPSCATRTGPGLGTLVLVGAMIAVPYAVALVAVRVIRKLDQDPDGDQ